MVSGFTPDLLSLEPAPQHMGVSAMMMRMPRMVRLAAEANRVVDQSDH